MINLFLKSPLPNGLAVAVLIALVVTLIASLVKVLGTEKVVTDRGWFACLLPAFSVLCVPAAIDLLQAKGSAPLWASVVFIAFLLNLILPLLSISRKSSHALAVDWYKWSMLASVVAGFAVAGYLTYVEISEGPVACGPSGGCDLVQNSRYATLFGFLKVGELGLLGFLGILVCWAVWMWGPAWLKKTAALALWAQAFFGTLFSAYLTFLEPFVIGATCMWCISSAVLMISLLLTSTPGAQAAFAVPEEDDDE
jgi:uncharacterized membrane protein